MPRSNARHIHRGLIQLKNITYVISVLAVIGVLYGVLTNYLDERADFVRTPPTELAKHPEATGIPGLSEISLTGSDGEKLAPALDYAPLPDALIKRALEKVQSIKY